MISEILRAQEPVDPHFSLSPIIALKDEVRPFATTVLCQVFLARSRNSRFKSRMEPAWDCGCTRIYEDTMERTPCIGQRSRHCTGSSFYAGTLLRGDICQLPTESNR